MMDPSCRRFLTSQSPIVMLLRRFRASFVCVCLLFHTCIPSHAAELLISEFMANNESALTDEDGEASDWIEIHNPGSNAVNLLNWMLTDSVNRPDKWIFPATNLPAGGYLIVFASEKNRRLPGAPLHTNFKLSNDGEFLSLGRPGFSLMSIFHPAYPRQFRDVSYGFGMQVSSALVISNGSLARFRVPSSAAHEAGWIEGSFDDASWREGAVPAGFEAGRDPVEDSYIGALLSTSPLVHYRFSETQGLGVQNVGSLGSRADASRVGAVATNQTGPQGSSFGGFESTNKAYRFGGSARVRVPSQPEFNLAQDPFALSFWFFPTSVETPSDLFTYRGAAGSLVVQFAAQGPGTFSIFHNRLLGGGGGIVANAWHHLALSRDSGGILSAYLNGDLVFAIEDPESLSIGTDWLIGAGHNGDPNLPTRGFGGRIDEFSFWSRSLVESEISDLYLTARTSPASYASHIRTDLTGSMHNVNSSVQVRIPFLLENPEEIDHLLLSLQYDDGAVVYLNGREVASLSAPESLSWNSRATARRPDRDAIVPVELDLSDLRGALTAGRNILAIQGLNLEPANPDFLIGVTLEVVKVGSLASSPGFFTTPTPGAPNGRASQLPGPIIRSLQHSPALPTDSDDLLITTSVSPSFANIASVMLRYRINYGVTNTLPMFDDGLHGDGGPSDGLYGAYVPAAASTNGQCIRYKVEALDVAGGTSRWPLFEDRLGSPEYQGTMVQGSPIASPLPIWHWWARAPENARTRNGERVSVFYNGEFFDNVFARERGGFTTSGSQKFDFNRGFRVKMSDEVGRVDEVNLNGNGSDPSYLRPPLAFETYRRAGNEACASFPVLMRLNGRTDRVAVFVEQVDPIFLKRWGFNDQGVLYKFVQRGQITPVFSDSTDGVEKETFRTESPNTDLQQIVDAIKLPTVAQRQAFFFDRFNIPQIINFLACRSITMDADDVRKNFYMYNDREGTGEWSIFPWDKDWTFGVLGDGGDALPHPFFGDPAHSKPDTQSNVLLDRLFNDPVTREMYLRRLRTLSDQMLQAPWTPTTHLDYERRVDLWAGLVS
ncbi:MAG: hypothetical protein FJ405_06715, partial [Verrucomicrobia bacterium]|nr:hypothetical protein [Verrucomicrobiota bacterium]